MAQKVTGIIKLQINAAKATASPPVGPALGQHGVNIAAFIKEFNARTKDMEGYKIPSAGFKDPVFRRLLPECAGSICLYPESTL